MGLFKKTQEEREEEKPRSVEVKDEIIETNGQAEASEAPTKKRKLFGFADRKNETAAAKNGTTHTTQHINYNERAREGEQNRTIAAAGLKSAPYPKAGKKSTIHRVGDNKFINQVLQKKEETYDEQTKETRLNAVLKIQRILRAKMARKEATRLVRDKGIWFRRKTLVDRLLIAPRSRATFGCGMCYMVFVTVFTLLITYSSSPTLFYNSAGSLKDQLLETSFDYGSNGWSVQTPNDFYSWAVAALYTPMYFDSTTKDIFLQGRTAYAIDSVFIAQQRSQSSSCDSLYTRFGTLPSYTSEATACALPLSDGIDTTSFGNTASSAITIENYTLNVTSTQAAYSDITSLQKCPTFTYNSASPFGDMHTVELPINKRTSYLTSSDWNTILSVLKNCNFIDRFTRTVEVQASIMIGNEEPIFAWIKIKFSWGLNGNASTSYSVVAIVIKDKDEDSDRDVAYGCIITLYVLFILGLLAVVNDIFLEYFYLGKKGLERSFSDPWNYIATAHYCLMIVAISLWIDIDDQVQSLEDASSFADVRDAADTINTAVIKYQIFIGMITILTYVRVLQYVRHRGLLSLLVQSLYQVVVPLMHFLVTFAIVVLGFTLCAWQMFGGAVENYSTPEKALITLLNALLGNSDYSELYNFNNYTSFFFYYGFMIFVSIIMMNFFVAIVLEGYSIVAVKGHINLAVWQEFKSNARTHKEHMRGKSVSSLELAWVLMNDPIYCRQRMISLLDIRQGFRLPFTPEVYDVLYYHLMEIEHVSDDVAIVVKEPPYRYLRISRAADPSWVHKFPTDWRAAILRANFFYHYYRRRFAKTVSILGKCFRGSNEMNKTPRRRSVINLMRHLGATGNDNVAEGV